MDICEIYPQKQKAKQSVNNNKDTQLIRIHQSPFLQVIKFSVCYFNVECGRTFFGYYDGNARNEYYYYCGLRNLVIRRSKENFAKLLHYDNTQYNANGFVIRYTSVLANIAALGKNRNDCVLGTLIARFVGPTWGPSGPDRTQVGPMLAPWTLLSGDQNIIAQNIYIVKIINRYKQSLSRLKVFDIMQATWTSRRICK